ncbi:hypothetical protein HNQ84_001339 [Anoxybacillus eryuanensis]
MTTMTVVYYPIKQSKIGPPFRCELFLQMIAYRREGSIPCGFLCSIRKGILPCGFFIERG